MTNTNLAQVSFDALDLVTGGAGTPAGTTAWLTDKHIGKVWVDEAGSQWKHIGGQWMKREPQPAFTEWREAPGDDAAFGPFRPAAASYQR